MNVTQSVTGCIRTRSMGTIVNLTLIVPTLQRGNASQDAPRPLEDVTRSVGMIIGPLQP